MYKAVNLWDFRDKFKAFEREEQFSYEGLKALFEYLEEVENENEQIELDVIALCCEFTEYENIDEYLKNYNTQINKEENEDFKEEIIKEIQEKTAFIKVNDESFIIKNY